MKNNKLFGLTDSLIDAVRQVMEKKLDPVGQADADIDNDGDVDSSDKYLHRRRKAIKKAMATKEAVSPAQQAAIAIAKKKAGTKPKNEGAMSRMASGGGLKTFKPKPKDPVDVKPVMKEASELPKKVIKKGHEIAKKLIKMRSKVDNPYAVGMATAKKKFDYK